MTDMVELCIDTIRAGRVPAVIERAQFKEASQSEAQFGLFSTDFGKANQIVQLNRYPNGISTRDLEVAANPFAGNAEDILFRERTILRPVKPGLYSAAGYSVYELRVYDVQIGRIEELAALIAKDIPAREQYSPNIGVWTPLTGSLERLFHLWAYRDFEHRKQALDLSRKDATWLAYLAAARPMLTTLSSTVMTPLSGSRLC